MRVGLVADVPDQAVARRVEDVVDRGGEFHDAEAGAEVAAGHRNGVDGFLAEFVRNLAYLLDLELAGSSGVRMVSRSGVLLNVVTAIFQFCMSAQARREMGSALTAP